VHVLDYGAGATRHQDKLVQSSFDTKPTGEGTALGLSINCDIVTRQHGGSTIIWLGCAVSTADHCQKRAGIP
jgi:hypothetical protein